jgi:hypothetical protein
MSPLRWTCKSTRRLAEELGQKGCPVSHTVVAEMLHALGYSLQANVKTIEGKEHPDVTSHQSGPPKGVAIPT